MQHEPEDLYPERKPRPRLRAPGTAYFITWRTAPSGHPLAPSERDVVLAALKHFDKIRYELLAAVVMDDHVHVVVYPIAPAQIDGIVAGWRSYTAHRLVVAGGRAPPLWQRNGFDRVVWEGGELAEKIAYVLRNPWRRWPEIPEYPWVWPPPNA